MDKKPVWSTRRNIYATPPEDLELLKRKKSHRRRVERLWSTTDIMTLIREVEARSILWYIGSDEYKLPKEHVWQEVADTIPASIDQCKGKWTNLRISFNTYVKKYRLERTFEGPNQAGKTIWKFFEPMRFLETYKANQSIDSSSNYIVSIFCFVLFNNRSLLYYI